MVNTVARADLGVDSALSTQDLSRWTATCNIHNQERLFREMQFSFSASGRSSQEAAASLGVDVETFDQAISGESDLTMTELRLLSIACEVVVDFRVTTSRAEFIRRSALEKTLRRMVSRSSAERKDVSWHGGDRILKVWETKVALA